MVFSFLKIVPSHNGFRKNWVFCYLRFRYLFDEKYSCSLVSKISHSILYLIGRILCFFWEVVELVLID